MYAGVNLFSVNGAEIVNQYYGESEQSLHEIFYSASRAAPAVVRFLQTKITFSYFFHLLYLVTRFATLSFFHLYTYIYIYRKEYFSKVLWALYSGFSFMYFSFL